MGYLLLVVGILLMALTWRETWETLSRPVSPEAGPVAGGGPPEQLWPAALADEVRLVHNKLEALAVAVESAVEGIRSMEEARSPQVTALETPENSFQRVLAQEEHADSYRQVYQAFDAGKTVTEIARELGRGRGEIELILSLRR